MTKIRISDPPPERETLQGGVRPWLRYAGIVAVAILAGSVTIVLYYGFDAFQVIRSAVLAPFW
ncbi:MAG: hypothetical protein H7Y08_00420 [Rhizobiaceae bacterium]|nr:hypothetical protein [Rhizobiaceae bacterium]